MEYKYNIKIKDGCVDNVLSVFAKAAINVSNDDADEWEQELCSNFHVDMKRYLIHGDGDFETNEDEYILVHIITILAHYMEDCEFFFSEESGTYGISIKDGEAYLIEQIEVRGYKYSYSTDDDGEYVFEATENDKPLEERLIN